MLDGCVSQAKARIDSHNIRTAVVWPDGQITHIVGDLGTTGSQRIDSVTGAYVQIVGEPATISVDRSRSEAQIRLDLQPADRLGVGSYDWPPLRQANVLHLNHRYPPFPQRGVSPRAPLPQRGPLRRMTPTRPLIPSNL